MTAQLSIVSMLDLETRLHNLLEWLAQGGTYISPKLEVRNNETSGRGLYAKESVMRSERLIRIPHSYLLNFTTAVAHIAKHNLSISLDATYHGVQVPPPRMDGVGECYASLSLETLLSFSSFQILAMYLMLESARGKDSFWKPFIDMLPHIDELGLTPLVWKLLGLPESDRLWRMLPRSARKHSQEVSNRFDKDFAVVSEALQDSHFLDRKRFLWAWMCINSRCLYMEVPQGKDSHDNFTLAPYVDFLNHLSEDQCGIKIDNLGFHVVTSSLYRPDQELLFSYGPHSNEFLLCEYGFTLPENKWNYVDITDYIVPLLKPKHVEFLKAQGYYGDYTVNTHGISFRTEVALATLQESEPETSRKLQALVNGATDGSSYEKQLRLLSNRILDKLMSDCDRRLNSCEPHTDISKAILLLYRDTKHICECAKR